MKLWQRKGLRIAASIIITGLALLLSFRKIDWPAFRTAFSQVRWFWVVLGSAGRAACGSGGQHSAFRTRETGSIWICGRSGTVCVRCIEGNGFELWYYVTYRCISAEDRIGHGVYKQLKSYSSIFIMMFRFRLRLTLQLLGDIMNGTWCRRLKGD